MIHSELKMARFFLPFQLTIYTFQNAPTRDLNIDKDIDKHCIALTQKLQFLKKFHENEKCVFSVAPRSVAIGILAHVSNDKRW